MTTVLFKINFVSLNILYYFILFLKNLFKYNLLVIKKHIQLLFILLYYILEYILYNYKLKNLFFYTKIKKFIKYKKFYFKLDSYKILHTKILNIKIISKVTKQNIYRRFSVLLCINNNVNWIGFGKAKHIYLSEAIILAKKQAFLSKIYFFKFLFKSILNTHITLKLKTTRLIIYKIKSKLFLMYNNIGKILFDYLNIYNLNIKLIGSKNINNIIHIIILYFKLNYLFYFKTYYNNYIY